MTDRDPVESDDVEISAHATLTSSDIELVVQLSRRATEADGITPYSEDAFLHLKRIDEHITHLVARVGHRRSNVIGYAQVDRTPNDEGARGELTVIPASRRRGIGSALLHAAQTEAGAMPLRIWAHGDLSAAQSFAVSTGYRVVRALWQMRRPLDSDLPEPRVPEGVTIRAFRPGLDDAAWLHVNSTSFAHHPEQGTWTDADLRLRMAEPWFDPNGFFVAERAGEMVGFHWTKVHADEPGETGPIGEVYVVGVLPTEAGQGLGRALTLVGLHYLRTIGPSTVLLYVDADNAPAVALYDRLGFTRWRVDAMYGPDADPA